TFDQPGLRQRLEQLADGGHLKSRSLRQLGRAQHDVRPRGKHGQHDGGVVGELGDAEHRGGAILESGPKLYAFQPPASNLQAPAFMRGAGGRLARICKCRADTATSGRIRGRKPASSREGPLKSPPVMPQCRLPPQTLAAMSTNKKKIEARMSPIHGNGIFATELIKKGERVIRYKGALRTHAEVDEDYGEDDENGHTFLFTL